MSLFSATRSVLGMNARNLHYISKFNSASNKKFADDKLFTKQFLGSRGIGVAKHYNTVRNQSELTDGFFASLPNDFVIKPNKGFGGAGIVVIVGRAGKSFLTPSGRHVTQDEMYRLCIEILDGKYSISGVGDWILVEERLEAHESFRQLTRVGLPDVRVIVFNNVPVLSMLRVPTYESEGKANMELGAIGLGIDIGSGVTTGGAYKSEYVTRMPNGASARGFVVPHWDEILLSCAKIQQMTKIGFLGVDIVITDGGIAVLELNARSGLKIQIANKAGLKGRLDKIKDLTIRTPEEAVQVAKTLFTTRQSKAAPVLDRPLIGPVEWATLNGDAPQQIECHVDVTSAHNVIDLPGFTQSLADVTLAGKRMKIPVVSGTLAAGQLRLGADAVRHFYIDPTKSAVQPNESHVTSTAEDQLKRFDKTLAEVSEQIKLLSAINPTNIAEQKKLFLTHPNFEPRFAYREQKRDTKGLIRDLQKLPEVRHPLYPLFDARRRELIDQVLLMEAVNTDAFFEASQRVFRLPTQDEVQLARAAVEIAQQAPADTSKMLSGKQAERRLQEYLTAHKLGHWQIVYKNDSAVDIQVTKQNKILLREGASFQYNRLEALLVHEIGTHVFRLENGRRQPWRLFERGTAGYLQTEEGLAVWNQNQLHLPLGPEKTASAALHVLTIDMASRASFQETFAWLTDSLGLTPERAWHHTLKAKRGVPNGAAHGAFTKDSLYFLGLQEIEHYLAQGGTVEALYVGKVTTADLAVVSDMKGLKAARWLPLASA